MARIAAAIQPDEVQFNTSLRPCLVKPHMPKEMDQIQEHFKGFRVSLVYEKMKPEVKMIDKGEVIKMRGWGVNLKLRWLLWLLCTLRLFIITKAFRKFYI